MATNRQTWSNVREMHIDVVEIDGYIAIAADAAVIAPSTAVVPGMAGRKEPVAGTTWIDGGTAAKPAGTGIYEVTLDGKYLRLLSCTPVLCINTAATVNLEVILLSDTVNISTALGAQKIRFLVRNTSAGAPADPGVVCGIKFTARLKNR